RRFSPIPDGSAQHPPDVPCPAYPCPALPMPTIRASSPRDNTGLAIADSPDLSAPRLPDHSGHSSWTQLSSPPASDRYRPTTVLRLRGGAWRGLTGILVKLKAAGLCKPVGVRVPLPALILRLISAHLFWCHACQSSDFPTLDTVLEHS